MNRVTVKNSAVLLKVKKKVQDEVKMTVNSKKSCIFVDKIVFAHVK